MTAFISLRTQFENLGDELINGILLREVSRRVPTVVLASGVPEAFLASALKTAGDAASNVKVCRSTPAFFASALKAAISKRENWLFLSPGDVSDGGSWRRTEMLRLLQKLVPSLRVAQVGASREKMLASQRELYRLATRRRHAITVRDQNSRLVMAAAGIQVPVVPDLAYLMDRPRRANPTTAVFSLRSPKTMTVWQIAERLRPYVEAVRTAGLEPVVSWQVTRDQQVCCECARLLRLRIVEPRGPRLAFEEALVLYRDTSIVVSNRLHVLLMAAHCGAIPIACVEPQDVKVTGAFDLAGLSALVARSERDDGSVLGQTFSDLPATWLLVAGALASANARLSAYFDLTLRPQHEAANVGQEPARDRS